MTAYNEPINYDSVIPYNGVIAVPTIRLAEGGGGYVDYRSTHNAWIGKRSKKKRRQDEEELILALAGTDNI